MEFFIVPGLIMLSVMTQNVSDASFGIFLSKLTNALYEVLVAPISTFELVLGVVESTAKNRF